MHSQCKSVRRGAAPDRVPPPVAADSLPSRSRPVWPERSCYWRVGARLPRALVLLTRSSGPSACSRRPNRVVGPVRHGLLPDGSSLQPRLKLPRDGPQDNELHGRRISSAWWRLAPSARCARVQPSSMPHVREFPAVDLCPSRTTL